MKKAIYFDMDGTLADFYNEPNWLADLVAQKTNPYVNAKPLIGREELINIIETLRARGYVIGVISWLSRLSTKEYKAQVRRAKQAWLYEHFGNIFNELHFVEYGTPKHRVANIMPSVLVDDNHGVNKAWAKHGGLAIDAQDITKILQIVP